MSLLPTVTQAPDTESHCFTPSKHKNSAEQEAERCKPLGRPGRGHTYLPSIQVPPQSREGFLSFSGRQISLNISEPVFCVAVFFLWTAVTGLSVLGIELGALCLLDKHYQPNYNSSFFVILGSFEHVPKTSHSRSWTRLAVMLQAFPLYWPSLFCTSLAILVPRDCSNETVSFTSRHGSDTNPPAAPSAARPDAHAETGQSPWSRRKLMPHMTRDLFVGQKKKKKKERTKKGWKRGRKRNLKGC